MLTEEFPGWSVALFYLPTQSSAFQMGEKIEAVIL
jgi:hypothetical protein